MSSRATVVIPAPRRRLHVVRLCGVVPSGSVFLDHFSAIAIRNVDTGNYIVVTAADAADPVLRRLRFEAGSAEHQYDAIWIRNTQQTDSFVRVVFKGPDINPRPDFATSIGTPVWDALYLSDGSNYLKWTFQGPDDNPTYYLEAP